MHTRIDGHRLVVHGRTSATVHLPSDLPAERSALAELRTLCDLPDVLRIACTPDFHKGAGTPVGTVMLSGRMHPGIVGNDIGCGIRLDVLEGPPPEVTPDLRRRLRHAFFEGGRDVCVPDRGRLLAEGLGAPLTGRTSGFIPPVIRAHVGGAFGGGGVSDVLAAYRDIAGPRCNLLGSIGGGNHFVEVGVVEEAIDVAGARRIGLRPGAVTVMVHSGSLDLGHQVCGRFKDRATSMPGTPRGLGTLGDEDAEAYAMAAGNCANFAMANRAVLAAMAAGVLDREARMVWDSPHNLAWETSGGFLHRKGATPASPGETVLVPGSSSTRSLVALGMGYEGTMSSAPHGAGRALSRNEARAADVAVPDVVTTVDPRMARPDVRREVEARLREEAPGAYKGIESVARCVSALGIARPLAWIRPLLTLKA